MHFLLVFVLLLLLFFLLFIAPCLLNCFYSIYLYLLILTICVLPSCFNFSVICLFPPDLNCLPELRLSKRFVNLDFCVSKSNY